MGRALARLDPADMAELDVKIGDIVEVAGKRATVCKVMPAYKELRGKSRIQIDGLSRENADIPLDQPGAREVNWCISTVLHARAPREASTPRP